MRVTVISDIHSNIQALRNVLSDIRKNQVDATYCLGDLVGYGPKPNEVVSLIKNLEITTIMGNYDDGVGFEKGDCGCAYITDEERENGQRSIDWTTENTTRLNKEFLQTLSSNIKVLHESFRFQYVHGSPRRINEYLYEDRPEESIQRLLKPLDIDVMVCGHTHKPYHRVVDGVHIINDGSVGKPKDGDPRACYSIITVDDDVSVEFRRVKYPVERVAKEIIGAGLPAVYADDIRTGGKDKAL